MLSPLNTNLNIFPLSKNPYLSRISTHFNEDKNYTMLAFNPGFALQAAELNEIQELFFLNQSLTQRMNANWIKINTGQTTLFTAPFWEGLIPLDPSYLTISNLTFTGSSVSFTYSLDPGWYFYTDPESKLSFWAYSTTNFSGTITTSSGPIYVGTNTSTSYIDCCQTNDSCVGRDLTLRDGSQQSYQEFTCGSSRLRININTSDTTTLTAYTTPNITGFSQIFIIDMASTTPMIKYPNGYVISALTTT